MTKEEFKTRWESNENGGGLTYNDVAACAKAWGLCQTPRTMNINRVLDMVLSAAGITQEG